MSYWRVIAKKLENNCLLNPFNTGTAHFLSKDKLSEWASKLKKKESTSDAKELTFAF